MAPSKFSSELKRVGGMLNRWKAELFFALCGSGIIAVLSIFSFGDLYLQYGRITRFFAWLVLIALGVVTVKFMLKSLAEKHDLMGMAAVVEIAFPELDNHLINFLQFSEARDNDPFKQAYLRRGVPEWSKVRLGRMKDRKKHMRANAVLAITLIMLITPFFFNGKAWGTAIWRVVNPFSSVMPISLTNIVAVEPGDTTALLGEPLMLRCEVISKHKGHVVHVDVDPSDNEKSTYSLGSVVGRGKNEQFTFRVPKITTDLRYRFRAGDAPMPQWYKVKARAPLALSKMDVNVVPPPYTGAKRENYDGLSDEIFVLQGSRVDLTVECNSALLSATVQTKGKDPVKLSRTSKDNVWKGTFEVEGGGQIKLAAKDTYGDELESNIKYTLVPDKPPTVEIISPKGRTMLPPNTDPMLEFAVVDDYGLAGLSVELLAGSGSQGKVIKTWDVANTKDFNQIWKHELNGAGEGRTLAYRIVARDNCPYKEQTVRSSPALFSAMGVNEAMEISEKLGKKAGATLSAVINLQRENISQTKQYSRNMEITNAGQWKELSERQDKIKVFTKALLANPLKPLGNLTDSISKCYLNEMTEAVRLLANVQSGVGPKEMNAEKALNKEEKILRTLTFASSALEQVDSKQKVSMLTAMLGKLVSDQGEVVAKTQDHARNGSKVSSRVVDKQEDLSMDLTEFTKACLTEATSMEANDAAYSASLRNIVAQCADKKIKNDMMISVDRLDRNQPSAALPSAQSAHVKLKEVQQQFQDVRASEEEERLALIQDALDGVKSKVGKVKRVHTAALESMDAVKDNLNKDTAEADMMEEEYQELVKNTKESMLQIPTDLHTFMELAVANEMAEDIVSVFEEVEEGALAEKKQEQGEAGDFLEEAAVKDLTYLQVMEEMEDRLDSLEMYLDSGTQEDKVLQEAFDKAEMPEEIALGAMATQLEDLVGELLEENDLEDDALNDDDGATNKQVSDWSSGGKVQEGEVDSFGAQGKSGNERPDHKEVSGRSGIGRQGMSNGESAAGSGTISEGDSDIEERRTQDPTQSGQVDVDGEADAKATGGGKQGSGKADEYGMAGGSHKMESTEGGSMAGLEALMSQCEAMHVKANMKNVKSTSLKLAAHHVRQLKDAIAQGRPLDQVQEYKKQAVASLLRAKTELSSGASMAVDIGSGSSPLDNLIETGSDEAPPQYRDLVNEYYKSLSEGI